MKNLFKKFFKFLEILTNALLRNRNAMFSIMAGAILVFPSFFGLLYVNDLSILPSLSKRFKHSTIFEDLEKRNLDVDVEIDCPFPVVTEIKATLQYSSTVWLSIFLKRKDDEKETHSDNNLNFNKCKIIGFKIYNQELNVAPYEKGDILLSKWYSISKIKKNKNSLFIKIKDKNFSEFDGRISLILFGLKSPISYSLQELVFRIFLKNTSSAGNKLTGALQYQRNHIIESIVPNPKSHFSYGFTNEMTFDSNDTFPGKSMSIIHVVYSDRELIKNREFWIIFFSALIGIGGSAIFQGLLEFFRK